MKNSIKIIKRTSFVLGDMTCTLELSGEPLVSSVEFVIGRTLGKLQTNALLKESYSDY